MAKIILLFDMDGVLIRSKGYYTSLQTSIKLIGQALGIKNAELNMDDISKLEAAGIFHIWDHLTYFSITLLLHSWKENPDLRIPFEIKSAKKDHCEIPVINFREYTKDLKPGHLYSLAEFTEFIREENNHLDSIQRTYIDWLVDSSREIYISPVLPIMQEFILGSDRFDQTYNQSSQLDVMSFPEQLDLPALSRENFDHLQYWLGEEEHHAAIFTSRPNLPPDKEYFGTPEAEIGAKITNLGNLPIIGAGSLDWMADKDQVPVRSYNKPNPVHALAAMQAAVGRDIKTSLRNAVNLTSQPRNSQFASEWQKIKGATVYVFEDSLGGLMSAQEAAQILSDAEIPIQLELIGISHQPDKTKSLLEISGEIYFDINSSPLIDIIKET